MSQARVDAADAGAKSKGMALKRTVKDKATGAMVYPLGDYQAYVKADQAFAKARIEHLTPKQKADMKSKTAKLRKKK